MYIAKCDGGAALLFPIFKMIQPLKKILIIDDEPGVRNSIGMFCGSIGYQAQLGGSLTEARSYLQKEKFGVLVVDYQLPDGCGLDLYDEIEDNSDISCFILMTGKDKEDIPKTKNLNDRLKVLLKPFDINKLLDIISA